MMQWEKYRWDSDIKLRGGKERKQGAEDRNGRTKKGCRGWFNVVSQSLEVWIPDVTWDRIRILCHTHIWGLCLQVWEQTLNTCWKSRSGSSSLPGQCSNLFNINMARKKSPSLLFSSLSFRWLVYSENCVQHQQYAEEYLSCMFK